MAMIRREVSKIRRIAGISKGVEIDDPSGGEGRIKQPLTDEVGTDETGAAGDEEIHNWGALELTKMSGITGVMGRLFLGALPAPKVAGDRFMDLGHPDSD